MYFGINEGRIAFADKIIIDNINFEIHSGEKIAVVGRNGCGKTSLLKVISGEYSLENGNISKKENEIGTLSQITFSDDSVTMGDELLKAFAKINRIQEKINILQQEMETAPSTEKAARFASLTENYRILGGYYYQKDYESIIKSFGFSQADKSKKLSEFSGGQRTKIAFMKLLLSKPDLLLLDEPTNHLDIKAIEWLESYLGSYPNAVVIVSHDREFLDRTVNIVYEIERGKIRKYTGNYSKFCTVKQELYNKQLKDYAEQQKEIQKINKLTERFRYKATKAKMVQSKLKYLEHMDIIEPPEKFDLRAFFSDTAPIMESGNDVLSAKDLEIGYDQTLSTISFELKKQCKVGIIGENGLGKSTLLKTLMGYVEPISGSFCFGANISKGYYDQQNAEYTSEISLFEDYRNTFPTLTDREIRSDLGAFLFSGDTVFKKISLLSGGEKVRLALCKLFKKKPNFLILDEPTNHLDIIGKEALTNMLKEYSGSLICVSHDRYFIKQVCDSILVFNTDKSTTLYPYDYITYENSKQKKEPVQQITKVSSKPEKKPRQMSPLKESGKVKTKITRIEKTIEAKEQEIEKYKAELNAPETQYDYIRITELSQIIENAESELNTYLTEWEELCNQLSELESLL